MISIVIPAYNEEQCIPLCLDSLINQKIKQKFEVIVVDNNSTDNTNKILHTYKSKLNLKIIVEKRQGKAIARQVGFKAAVGIIIFSLDADVITPQDWLEKSVKGFKDDDVVAVSGNGIIKEYSWIKNMIINGIWIIGLIVSKIFTGHWWLPGYNFAIRKAAYEKVGGFNPKLKAKEDSDLEIRVAKIGKIVWSNPTVVVAGRRFKHGIFNGYYENVKCYIDWRILKKATIFRDIR